MKLRINAKGYRGSRGAGALLLLLLAWGGFTAAGIDLPTNGVSSYSCRSWYFEDGLPHNAIQSVTQTRDGYIWAGTRNGLARFDGVRFKVFKKADTPWMKSDYINRVYGAADGSLWVGFSPGGLVRVRGDRFWDYTQAAGADTAYVITFYEDRRGDLWVGLRSGVRRFRDGVFHAFANDHPLAKPLVKDFHEDMEGMLWVGTGAGVFGLKGERVVTNLTFSGGLQLPYVHAVLRTQDKKLWVSTTGAGLNMFERGRVTRFAKAEGLAENYASVLFEDHAGMFWAGTHGGLNRMEAGRFVPEYNEVGMVFGVVNQMMEDGEGNLWVATRDGLSRLKAKRFITLTQQQGLTHNSVLSTLEDRRGNLWIATWGGGVNILSNGNISAFNTTNGLWADQILSLCEDRQGAIWIGGDFELGVFRYKNGVFTRYARAEGLLDSAVRTIIEDREGNLWLGLSGGLYRFRGGVFTRLTRAEGLAGNVIRVLREAHDGALWIGTETGLSILQQGRITNYTDRSGLVHNTIYALYEDDQEDMWLGTRGGLMRCRKGAFTSYSMQQGLFDKEITEIIEDDFGHLWLGSPRGVFRVGKQDLEELDAGKKSQVRCVAYGKPDGMLSPICVTTAKPAGAKTRDGRIWFPTTKGLVVTMPRQVLKGNDQPPAVYIEEVIADGQTMQAEAFGRIPPGQGQLEFHYTALSYYAAELNRFRYRLAGQDRDWIEAGTRRVAYYNNLAPGRYQFQVKACNSDGVWNETGAEAVVVLRPHFWQTWWFASMLVLGLGGGIFGLARYVVLRKMRAKLERMRQEQAMDRERARIARDLHDDLGSNLTRISLLTDMAETTLERPEESLKYIRDISTKARNAVGELDEIVWAVNPKNDHLDHLATYIEKYASEFFAHTPIRCRLEIPPVLPPILVSAETRHHLFLSVKEALNNALKYSQATEVRVTFAVSPDYFSITVSDNGKGFDPALLTGQRNGLPNMRRRIEDVGGRFQLQTAPGQGTTITLTLPIPP